MREGVAFLLGLLDRDLAPRVAFEDFQEQHGPALRQWQRLGFVAREPGMNPVPGCPHCGLGNPYLLRGCYRCSNCGSAVDRRHLLLWPLDLEAFLGWLAGQWRLGGRLERLDERFWQLGTFWHAHVPFECFFCRSGGFSDRGRTRLLAFRNAIVLHALPCDGRIEGFHGPRLSLLELVRQDGTSLTVTNPQQLLRTHGNVRFDEASGVLWAGDACLGEIPVGCKEYYMILCLWRDLDRYVPYSDVKRHVLQRSGTADSTEEATFCQKLKSRIKKKWIPEVNRLIVTTNKGHGYRLRAVMQDSS